MAQHKIAGNVRRVVGEPRAKQPGKRVAQVGQKRAAAFARQYGDEVAPAVAQVIEHMRKPLLRTARGQGKIMRYLGGRRVGEHVTKQVFAQLAQQVVTGGKMRVKRCAPHVGGIHDFLYRHAVVAFLRQELYESGKNGFSRFLLPAVHGVGLLCFGTDGSLCTVSYDGRKMSVACGWAS